MYCAVGIKVVRSGVRVVSYLQQGDISLYKCTLDASSLAASSAFIQRVILPSIHDNLTVLSIRQLRL